MSETGSREFLRHTLATLAYRAGKALRGAPDSFASFRCSDGGRSPVEIVAHMGDLMDWGLSIAQGNQKWNNATPQAWGAEVNRFFAALKAFDDFLASDQELGSPAEKLFQGPVADALNHTGQVAMLRRMAGAKIKGENYFVAEIASGTVGLEQAAPKREF